MKKVVVKNLGEMEKAAENFLRKFSTSASTNSATIIYLSGDLGSGKTTFVQFIGKLLGISEKINSPTFVVSKNYALKNQQWKNMIHIDAYRLGEKNDIQNIGLDTQMQNPENIIFIEWAEVIKKGLPKNIIEIEFEYISENERSLEIL